jgi:hypothetical protein
MPADTTATDLVASILTLLRLTPGQPCPVSHDATTGLLELHQVSRPETAVFAHAFGFCATNILQYQDA